MHDAVVTWRAPTTATRVTNSSCQRGTLRLFFTPSHAAMSTHRILGHRSLALGSSFLWGAIELFALWRSRHFGKRHPG